MKHALAAMRLVRTSITESASHVGHTSALNVTTLRRMAQFSVTRQIRGRMVDSAEAIVSDLASSYIHIFGTNAAGSWWQQCGICRIHSFDPEEEITHTADCPWVRAQEFVSDSSDSRNDE